MQGPRPLPMQVQRSVCISLFFTRVLPLFLVHVMDARVPHSKRYLLPMHQYMQSPSGDIYLHKHAAMEESCDANLIYKYMYINTMDQVFPYDSAYSINGSTEKLRGEAEQKVKRCFGSHPSPWSPYTDQIAHPSMIGRRTASHGINPD